ncbi:hypothetical protein [Nocardia nova]
MPSNPFDTQLPMVRPVDAPAPDPDDSNDDGRDEWAHDAHDDDAEPLAEPPDDDEYDDDEGEDWQQWLGERPHSVQMTAQSWDIPDYDATDGYDETRGAAAAPVLVDRSGARTRLAARRRPRRPVDLDDDEDRRGRGGVLLSLLIGVGLAVVVAALVLNFVVRPGHKTATPRPSTVPAVVIAPTSSAPATTPAGQTGTAPTSTATATSSAAAAVATDGCQQITAADHASGTRPGGTSDAPSAILAFEHAYYVQRSGAAARAVVAQDATVPDAAHIQTGIDAVPVGTRYCVQITRTAAGGGALWAVDLTEQWPGEAPAVWHQIVTVTQVGGRTLISGISPA